MVSLIIVVTVNLSIENLQIIILEIIPNKRETAPDPPTASLHSFVNAAAATKGLTQPIHLRRACCTRSPSTIDNQQLWLDRRSEVTIESNTRGFSAVH